MNRSWKQQTTKILVTQYSQYYTSQPNHKDCNQYISNHDMIECSEIHYSEPNSNDRSQPERKIGTNSDLTCIHITKYSTILHHNVTLLNLWTKSQSINQMNQYPLHKWCSQLISYCEWQGIYFQTNFSCPYFFIQSVIKQDSLT